MQIIYGGKLSWLQRLVEIRGQTFAIVSFMNNFMEYGIYLIE